MSTCATPKAPPPHRAASRWVIPLLVAVCGLPPLLAGALYYSGWKPAHTFNRGTLLQPPRAMPDVSFRRLDGMLAQSDEAKGAWRLVYVTQPGCPPECRAVLGNIQRVRQALGEQGRRVLGIVIVSAPPAARSPVHPMLRDQPGLLVRRTDDASLRRLTGALAGDAQYGIADNGNLYLVDPRGWVILRYTSSASPADLIADLKPLLSHSWIG